mmetsp:Transcript_5416/g.12934  ORF Transcript_5416/g.12934 Transcript_5416/m.12934 type:complete len:381 (+) Transcript_5416:278-1420(+)
MYRAYTAKYTHPMHEFMRKRLSMMVVRKMTTVPKRMPTPSSMPSTFTGVGSSSNRPTRNHGMPRPSRISKTLEPTALAMAMSASPSRATIMDASASGTEVPTASTTIPMTGGSTSRMQPICDAKSTMNQQMAPIHKMDRKNANRKNFCHFSWLQSGTEMVKSANQGSENTHNSLSSGPSSAGHSKRPFSSSSSPSPSFASSPLLPSPPVPAASPLAPSGASPVPAANGSTGVTVGSSAGAALASESSAAPPVAAATSSSSAGWSSGIAMPLSLSCEARLFSCTQRLEPRRMCLGCTSPACGLVAGVVILTLPSSFSRVLALISPPSGDVAFSAASASRPCWISASVSGSTLAVAPMWYSEPSAGGLHLSKMRELKYMKVT